LFPDLAIVRLAWATARALNDEIVMISGTPVGNVWVRDHDYRYAQASSRYQLLLITAPGPSQVTVL